ncbi:rhomboid family intramembrane serine protease [Hespellia stercorisuis]|uniref:rhomboid family intramembrane serine protease n=1 Tax=Hespellia stercorisuis TaxID=180311 RepID=UPI001FA8DD29|nr:rhomboid family intramembrane serine protease [Hespellia stercorisuis]
MDNKNKKAVCTIALVAANIIVFLGLSFIGRTEDAEFMVQHGAMYDLYVVNGHQYYRMFTSLFLHFGVNHLFNNMVMLGVLGWTMELEIGKIRYLIIYFVSGLGGNMLSLCWNVLEGESVVSAGASGAIFGLVGAMLYMAIRNRGSVGNVSGRGLIFMVVLTLYYGLTSSGVDNLAHIGGLVAGFILAVLLYHPRRAHA